MISDHIFKDENLLYRFLVPNSSLTNTLCPFRLTADQADETTFKTGPSYNSLLASCNGVTKVLHLSGSDVSCHRPLISAVWSRLGQGLLRVVQSVYLLVSVLYRVASPASIGALDAARIWC